MCLLRVPFNVPFKCANYSKVIKGLTVNSSNETVNFSCESFLSTKIRK